MTFPKKRLLTIYKSFVRQLLDYADSLYDKTCHETFKGVLEAFKCNACIPISVEIKETSQERLYRELGLKTLSNRRWSRKLFFFIKSSKDFPLNICKKFKFS